MIKNLVFEGGGIKGIAYGGALQEMEKIGLLNNVRRVAGTSAGAITAILLAVGYTASELSKIIADTNFNAFSDDDIGILRDAYRLINNYGIHKGNTFFEWIGELIKQKAGKTDLTFQEAFDLGFLDLYLVSTNLTKQRSEIFSFETTPNTEIRLAARMSMSIPFYYQCVIFNGDVMVDGGLADNYPIKIFDYAKYMNLEYKILGSVKMLNPETLGFRLDTNEEIQFNLENWSNIPRDISNFAGYTQALIGYLMDMANKKHLSKQDKKRTIFIDTLDVQTTDFYLPQDRIAALLLSGRNAIKNWVGSV